MDKLCLFLSNNIKYKEFLIMQIPNPQSPIPNPQSPIPNII